MARAMNISKRVTAAQSIVAKTLTSSARAERMAEELLASFGEVRTPEGKAARDLARQLTKLSGSLAKINEVFAKAF